MATTDVGSEPEQDKLQDQQGVFFTYASLLLPVLQQLLLFSQCINDAVTLSQKVSRSPPVYQRNHSHKNVLLTQPHIEDKLQTFKCIQFIGVIPECDF